METAPLDLVQTQQWFASIITRPVDENNRMEPLSPSGNSMEEEAARYVAPSPTLKPHERIQIYNQQYWWRLLNVLQEDFPFLLRLFGYRGFNEMIAIPYYVEIPPNHWSINVVSFELPSWLEKNYHEKDKRLVVGAASIDGAYIKSFFSTPLPPMDLAKAEKSSLQLQTHVHLFSFHLPLFELREAFLKEEPPFWEENDFPKLSSNKPKDYVLWRSKKNGILYKEIDPTERWVLEQFKKPMTLDTLCEWLEKQPKQILQTAEANLHLWFQKWTAMNWLALIDI